MLALLLACAASSPDPADPCEEAGNICTIAGNGTLGLSEDGLPATESMLYWPVALAWHPDGRLLILDFNTHLLRTIEPDGTLGTLAGNGMHAPSVEGVDALDSPFDNPSDVAVLADGQVLVAGWHESRVREIDASNVIRAFAATGAEGYAGDGGAAVLSKMLHPWAIAARDDGTVWVADSENHVVRVVTPDGRIDTYAGTGEPGYAGDGGPAEAATFDCPEGLWLDDDALYVADTRNDAVRRIDLADRTITTVAGTGEPGWDGDGGPATEARLTLPMGGLVGPDGALWIADTGNDVIRRVDASGTIDTVVGDGLPGFAGDRGPARDASLYSPRTLLFDGDGALYVTDTDNGRVRRVAGMIAP